MNARAGRARRDPALAERLREIAGKDAVVVTQQPDDVAPALAALRAQGADTLMFVGGDGTVAGCLTPLLRTWPADDLPAVALVRGGTVNTIAKSLGSRGAPERVARRLLERTEDARSRRLAVVRVRADAGDPVFGMIFVNGVGVRWLQMYYEDSSLGVRGATSVVARIAGSALARGELARRMFAPFSAELEVDGRRLPARDYTVMAAAGVREIGLGFAPFHSAGSDPTRIHLATTGASALGCLREMPALRAGRPMRSSAITHYPMREARIRTTPPEPWSLDADTFPPARELQLAAGPALAFVTAPSGFR